MEDTHDSQMSIFNAQQRTINKIEEVIKLITEKKLPEDIITSLNSSLSSIIYCAPEDVYNKCDQYATVCYRNQDVFDKYGITEGIKEIMQS